LKEVTMRKTADEGDPVEEASTTVMTEHSLYIPFLSGSSPHPTASGTSHHLSNKTILNAKIIEYLDAAPTLLA
jgi:hypothetical protein